MPDAWRLQRAVAHAKDERLALVFVDDAHPAVRAVDHLERHVVEVDVVGDRPAGGDLDVRRDEPPPLPVGEQVAVTHSSAALGEGRIAHPTQHEGRSEPWQHEWWPARHDPDERSVRRREVRGSPCDGRGIVASETDHAGTPGRAALESEPHAVPGQNGYARVVGRMDRVEAEAEPLGEETERAVKIRARKHDLGVLHVGVTVGPHEGAMVPDQRRTER